MKKFIRIYEFLVAYTVNLLMLLLGAVLYLTSAASYGLSLPLLINPIIYVAVALLFSIAQYIVRAVQDFAEKKRQDVEPLPFDHHPMP